LPNDTQPTIRTDAPEGREPICLRLWPAEVGLLRTRAMRAGLSLNEYVRRRLGFNSDRLEGLQALRERVGEAGLTEDEREELEAFAVAQHQHADVWRSRAHGRQP